MKKKRILSVLLTLCMVIGLLPVTALAAGDDGLCEHHMAHTAECGYVAAKDAVDCDKECAETNDNGVIVHDEGCAYAEEVEGNSCTFACKECELDAMIAALPNWDEVTEENAEQVQRALEAIQEKLLEVGVTIDDDTQDDIDTLLAVVGLILNPESVPEMQKVMSSGEQVMSGTCGATVNWVLEQNNDDDNPTYTLNISGSGPMADYISGTTDISPWKDMKSKITQVYFSEGITTIGASTIRGCTMVETINLPSSIIEIGNRAFAGCSGLKGTLKIPEGVQSIGTYAFYGCTGFTGTLVLPDTITKLEAQCFEGCSGFNGIRFPENNQLTVLPANICSKWVGMTSFPNIPENITKLGGGSFKETGITELNIPAHVTDISQAFRGCKNLTEVTIPENVTEFGGAFSGCENLTNVVILSQVSGIDSSNDNVPTFYGCKNLRTISVPETVKVVGKSEFSGCSSLQTTDFIEKLDTIGENAFLGCTSLTGRLKLTAKSIGMNAFKGCTGLGPDITLVNTEGFNQQAFDNCTGLTGTLYLGNNESPDLPAAPKFYLHANGRHFSKIEYHGSDDLNNTFIRGLPAKHIDLSGSGFSGNNGVMVFLSESTNQTINISGCEKLNTVDFNSFGTNSLGTLKLILDDTTKDITVKLKSSFTPIRDGYTFDGWYSNTAHTSAITFNGKLKDGYAKWVSKINLDPNGGNCTTASVDVPEGKTISEADMTLPIPTRTGYTFEGWYTAKTGGTKVEETYAPTGNTTLYAQWTMPIEDTGYMVNAILDQTYTGVAIEPAVVVKKNDTVLTSGYTVEYKDNTDVGIATVKVTIGAESAEVKFNIVKDTAPIVEMADVSVTYGTDYNMTATAKTSAGNVITDGTIGIKYYTNADCTEGESDTAPTNAGTYYAKATLTGTDNYAQVSKIAKIEISKATFSVAATGYSGTYDSQPHSVTVTADNDVTVTYSTDGENYVSENPTFINAGTHTVYYKATKANHNDVTGSVAVEINKANPELKLSADSGSCRINRGPVTFTYTYDGDGVVSAISDNTDVATATASASNGTVTVELKSVGTAKITVSAAAGSNYNEAQNVTYDLTVLKKASSSSSSDSGSSSVKPAEKPEEKPAEPDVKPEEKPAEPVVPTNPAEVPAAEKIVLTVGQRVANAFGSPVVNDVAPIIREDRTMLPIRFVAEALGAAVTWDDALNKVSITKGDDVIDIYIGSVVAFVNGSPVELDSPAFIETSRTYLPLRFVAENLGATVFWDAETQEVTIVPNK